MNFVTKRQLRSAVRKAVEVYNINPSDPPAEVKVEITQPNITSVWRWRVRIVQQRELSSGLRRISMRYMGGMPHRFDRCDGWVGGKARSWSKANEQARFAAQLLGDYIKPMLEIVVLHELDLAENY